MRLHRLGLGGGDARSGEADKAVTKGIGIAVGSAAPVEVPADSDLTVAAEQPALGEVFGGDSERTGDGESALGAASCPVPGLGLSPSPRVHSFSTSYFSSCSARLGCCSRR